MSEFSSILPIESNTGEPQDGISGDERDPKFVSMMPMYSQETSSELEAQERALITAELGLSGPEGIVFDDEGWGSRVYLVNDGETVYKFPRSPEVMQGYAKEIAALVLLGTVETNVITQQFKRFDPSNRYFSYQGIIGTQLSELLESLEVDEKERIGGQIGSFLKQFHGLDMDNVPTVTATDEVEEYKDKYRLSLPVIKSEFSPEEQSTIAALFLELLPAEMARLGDDIRLCHGDLGSYNIIIGEDGSVGIIDFGNVGYYDQSKDFIDFGDNAILNAAFEAYGDTALLRAKTAIRMAALPAIDLVYYTSKKDNQGINATVGKLRSSLRSLPNNVGDI